MTAQLNAYLHSEDARAQAAFYTEALGGEIRSVMTYGQVPGTPEASKDKVMHMVLALAGENTLFLADSTGPASGGRAVSLALSYGSVDEAAKAYGNLAQGGTEKFPFGPQPWGAHFGEIEDKFGITWQIVAL